MIPLVLEGVVPSVVYFITASCVALLIVIKVPAGKLPVCGLIIGASALLTLAPAVESLIDLPDLGLQDKKANKARQRKEPNKTFFINKHLL